MNPGARREVIGQVIDYLASLADLTAARRIEPRGWPYGISYNSWQPRQNESAVQLPFTARWREVADCLASFGSREVSEHNAKLIRRPNGKLKVEIPIEPTGRL
jgi:hypothetical protein